mmetsp:Transcript_33632/g.94467  ORF Transcript_33632/g.94467 Transcript_33632/m.94467 type:complete len:453 (+) Transcript_33632:106-1464(+)
MSMHTTQEWHQHTGFNMTQAQHSHSKAHKQNDRSQRAHEDTVNDNVSGYNDVQGSMEQKIKSTHRVLEKLQRRAASLEDSINQTKASHAQLEAALRAKEAPLQLCMWRMEQREKRPLREQVRDIVEVALESEKATIIDTQRKLHDAIKRTKVTIHDLEEKLEEVRHDIGEKKQALSVDEMCLRNTKRSYQTVLDRTPPPGGTGRMSTTQKTYSTSLPLHESSRNESNRIQEAERLSQSGSNREAAAKALREDNSKIIARCQKLQEDACAKTERCTQERVNENQQVRRRLEDEIRGTHDKIDHTKNTITETRYQMKALEEPMDLTATCSSWRKQRATREHITDPVSTKIREHQMTVMRAHQDLSGHHSQEKGNLHDLKERRDRLNEDLRDKTAALHIDLNCLTHEGAHTTGGNGTARQSKSTLSRDGYRRLMSMDRSFVPSASGAPNMPLTAR